MVEDCGYKFLVDLRVFLFEGMILSLKVDDRVLHVNK
jgi:hypothetical protein